MVTIRKFTANDTAECALLMISVYKKFNSKEATKEAIEDFTNSLHPEKVHPKILFNKMKKPIFFVATNNQRIIGLVRGTPDRISSLFIDGNYQKKGVGKRLIESFENAAQKYNSTSISVRSSLLAISFYEKFGFKKTTGLRKFHGMKMYPMKKILT